MNMGIVIVLTDENGKEMGREVIDPKDHLHRLLPLVGSDSHFLKYIDWYGDTIFNREQITDFLDEWLRLEDLVDNDEERQIVADVADLARRLQEEVHVYLKFEGD